MKKQVFNPYLPSFEYVPDGEPRVFTVKNIVKMIMFAGQLQLMIFQTGNMRVLFIKKNSILEMEKIYYTRLMLYKVKIINFICFILSLILQSYL